MIYIKSVSITRTLALGVVVSLTGCAIPLATTTGTHHSVYPADTPDESATSPQRSSAAHASSESVGLFADQTPINYVLVQAGSIGVTNAVHDESNTYIGLREPVPENLTVFDTDGKKLMFCKHGRVVGVKGVHRGLLFQIGQENSYVAKDPMSIKVNHHPLGQDPDVTAVRKEIAMVSQQMQAFDRAFAKSNETQRRGPAGPEDLISLDVDDAQQIEARPRTYERLSDGTVRVRVYFGFGSKGSAQPDQLTRLLSMAHHADRITLVGYTDSLGPAAVNKAVAKKRAKNIAEYLTSEGIDESRIRIEAIGSGNFIGSNRTSKGRALNRRVEALLTQDVARLISSQ